MKKSLVYTKTGDAGSTSLASGERVPKTHPRLEAYGTLDELNSFVGWLQTALTDADECLFVEGIQHNLFAIGAFLATAATDAPSQSVCRLTAADVSALESAIDRLDSTLPPLRAFVLPGGTPSAALCHVCRTVCRRAERRILSMSDECPVPPVVLSYVNRLSDYFFVLSRKLNVMSQNGEKIWNNSRR